eukprot:gnl/TRDRNA2_/TRDRNA2_48536_c0_seq1.p1 gnl/TRDRNA2_/TRDRNA2_48536_c0~~gnl/TRDRNA2_/TRDRNA2_48536_c0_seq1.p1  ORF type:complete len:309 (+),score=29.59 gnl/TRDRNA2_/TRDRNA2_48536_c0_seq1:112-927(+)
METTLDVKNDALWQRITPRSVLTWARCLVANRLARTGDEWTILQLKYQSGTCNNQWIVVDYKLFVAGQPLLPGTVWISETMPGVQERADVTNVLNGPTQAWFSYNIPYFSLISREGGYVPPKSSDDSWLQCPRAKIHAREVAKPTIKDLSSFVAFMRYSNRTDPLAKGDACNGISARCDLNPTGDDKFDCFGAVDLKVATSALFDKTTNSSLAFHGIWAPSWNDQDNAPFQWSKQGQGCYWFRHGGQPDLFNFSMHTYPDAVPSAGPVVLV